MNSILIHKHWIWWWNIQWPVKFETNKGGMVFVVTLFTWIFIQMTILCVLTICIYFLIAGDSSIILKTQFPCFFCLSENSNKESTLIVESHFSSDWMKNPIGARKSLVLEPNVVYYYRVPMWPTTISIGSLTQGLMNRVFMYYFIYIKF